MRYLSYCDTVQEFGGLRRETEKSATQLGKASITVEIRSGKLPDISLESFRHVSLYYVCCLSTVGSCKRRSVCS